jgi:hypothetical protein
MKYENILNLQVHMHYLFDDILHISQFIRHYLYSLRPILHFCLLQVTTVTGY